MSETTPAEQVVARLSRRDKIRLLSGHDFWSTERLGGVESITLTDGPHGVRKQVRSGDHLGLSESVPATCFPTASALGATWDLDLLEEVGAALGAEAREQGVGVLLGPGLNIKRHPAGGRNFEYLSEDPLLSGRAAAAMVRGIQSRGVGACLKHFAANNQEHQRMRLDTIVDERTLREIYLAGFETAVRESAPWTVMSSYNKLNGEHTGESRRLLHEILREEWGFDGLVVSDWLGVSDRPVGVRAGMDLEMPGSGGAWDPRVAAALESGQLSEEDLDTACARVVALVQRVAAGRSVPVAADFDAHHDLARRAAAAATVLLTNDGILPLAPTGSVALIGAMARVPRFQGAGSSLVNPTRVDALRDALGDALGDRMTYADGYDAATGDTSPGQLAEARALAGAADAVVLVVGLPARYESEGFDREHLRLPAGHEALVEAVLAANPRTAVVLVNGAPVEMGWAERPAALVEAYLGGQAAGSALAQVLVGQVEPGGRLAESIPVSALELPAHAHFAHHPTQVEYRETFHVGYRFHDTAGVAPRFAFGHGLGYTTFDVAAPVLTGEGTQRRVAVRVTNTGERAGSTVVQAYVGAVGAGVARPDQELRAFAKVFVEPGESRLVGMSLDERAFAHYDVATSQWVVAQGEYEIRVGLSSRDIREVVRVQLDGVVVEPEPDRAHVLDDAAFAAVLGRAVPTPAALAPFHEDSTIGDLEGTWLGRRLRTLLLKVATRRVDLEDGDNSAMMAAAVNQMPLRGVVMAAGGQLPFAVLKKAIRVLNAARRP